jgi:hypothetical protein
MAIYTDFFVASEEELRATFPRRVPVAERPVERESRNPFTGESWKVKEWVPAEPFPELRGGTTYPRPSGVEAVRRLPLAQWKKVDQVKLATLQQFLAGGEFQPTIEALFRPALVAPGDEDSKLFRLPREWVEAVAGIDAVGPLAEAWAATEECRLDNWSVEDAAEVIVSLRDLARRALAESKGMFLWVNA